MPSAIMQHFSYDHLQGDLRNVSAAVCQLATAMDVRLPDCAEKSAGLRKLLEAKDCFVRAAIEDKNSAKRREQVTIHNHGAAQHSHAGGSLPHGHGGRTED